MEIKLYCPLMFVIEPDDKNSDYIAADSANYVGYESEINAKIAHSLNCDKELRERGLPVCCTDKIISVTPGVESRNGDIYGAITVKYSEDLSGAELSEVTAEIERMLCDDWGEEFEQRKMRLGNDIVYVSFWNDENYFLKPENEAFPEIKTDITIGGI